MASTRWNYSFSNLGPKKQIAGTTFYKVSVGSDTKWLSMEGIRMLEKAKRADVAFKVVRKAVTHYTAAGTKRRVKFIRANIQRDLEDLLASGMDGFEFIGKQKGIQTMLENAGLEKLAKEFAGLLEIMNEEQLREFYARNKTLLQKFFADSDIYKKATSVNVELSPTDRNVKRNAEKLREQILKQLTRDMSVAEIEKVKDPEVMKLLMAYKKGHL